MRRIPIHISRDDHPYTLEAKTYTECFYDPFLTSPDLRFFANSRRRIIVGFFFYMQHEVIYALLFLEKRKFKN